MMKIHKLDIAIIFRHSNITSTDCRVQPNSGAEIMLAVEPAVSWGCVLKSESTIFMFNLVGSDASGLSWLCE